MFSIEKNILNRLNLLLFLIGLGGAIYVQKFGTFSVAEPLLVGVLIAFLLFEKLIFRSIVFLLFVTLLWLLGIQLSDWYNDIPFENTIKLTGSVVLYFTNILAFYFLLRKSPRSSIAYVAGCGISYLLQFYYFPPPLATEDFARGFAELEVLMFTWVALTHYVALMCVASILWYCGWVRLSVFILLLAAAGSLYLGSRAYFLIGLISAIALYLISRIRAADYLVNTSFFSGVGLLKVGLLIVFVTYVAGLIYKEAALHGMLGEYAYDKYIQQSGVEGLGVASGRLGFFESLYAVIRSPLLGYGSFGLDREDIQIDFAKLMGLPQDPSDLVPCHSHILGAWVWSGVLSVPFWLLIIFNIFKSIFVAQDFRLLGICIPFSAFLLWHILFSPIGYRVDLSFYVGLLFVLKDQLKYRVHSFAV